MYQPSTTKHLESNEYPFTILDEWMKKYNTSPKKFLENDSEVTSLSIEWADSSQNLIGRDDALTKLKNWAIANRKIVIITSCAIITCASSTAPLNVDDLFEITPGIYYVDENNKIVSETVDTNALFAEGEIDKKDETSVSIPSNLWMEDSITRSSVNRIIDEYMLSKEVDADSSSKESEASIEPPSSENIVETPKILANGAVEISIPTSVIQTGLCANITNYNYYYGRWNKSTMQRVLSDQWDAAGRPSSNGIATLNGRYLVAVSTKFGKVGDNIDIVLRDGQIIPATIADAKGIDATSEWGHVFSGAVDIVEWEVVVPQKDVNLGSWRNVKVDKIINYNTEVVPQPVEKVDEEATVNSEELQYIHLYSEIYGLDEKKVYQILCDMTDGFSNELYQQYNFIGRATASEPVICDSKEMAISLAIRDIHDNPEQYGITSEETKDKSLVMIAQDN